MNILLPFLGGIIPPIIWLWFWLKEDAKNPEPKKYILITFLVGMFVVIPTIYIEKFVIENSIQYSFVYFILLSMTEEIFKFIGAYFTVLKRKVTDEPIDAVIYMVTVALGFAATENSLYLLNSLEQIIDFYKKINIDFNFWTLLSESITNINMRFIGANVLHTTSSAIIGVSIAFSFYKKNLKKLYLFIGLILSIALHTSFNFFIIKGNGESIFKIFIAIWIIAILLLLLLEKIKKIKPNY